MKSESLAAKHMEVLSRLTIRGQESRADAETGARLEKLRRELRYVARLSEQEFANFVELANNHHVIVRALDVVQSIASSGTATLTSEYEKQVVDRCESVLAAEQIRIERASGYLHSICDALETRGCRVAVIKSLDHWPDLGSDLDLYTTADEGAVQRAMREQFGARPVDRSWGDRLAHKWNFSVPGLPELVEIHVQFLGQTGEHAELARRVIERRVPKNVGGYDFLVAASEERVVISTLQRVYRHFYFRLCDMVDTAALLQSGAVDFAELKRAANSAGIWPGVATYLQLLQNYVQSYGGTVGLPDEVIRAAYSPASTVQFKGGYLRVSKATGARLYSSQLLEAGKHGDVRALLRLPLLPPLAISALVAHGLTGDDKGIW
ncbi:MAG: nucleotidyltransferase family protein [Terriglobales bacterium]